MRGGQSISPSTFRALFHCLLFKKHFVPFRCSLKIMHHFFLGAFKFSIFSGSARMFLGDFLLLVLIKFAFLDLWLFVFRRSFKILGQHCAHAASAPASPTHLWGFTCTCTRNSLLPKRLALCVFTPFPSTLPAGAFLRTLACPLSATCYDLLFKCSFQSFYTSLLECLYASLPFGFNSLMKLTIFHSRSQTYCLHFKVPSNYGSTW